MAIRACDTPPAAVVRLPVRSRPRLVTEVDSEALAASGLRVENRPSTNALGLISRPKKPGGLDAIDRLLETGALTSAHYVAARAYATLRRRHDRAKHGGGGLAPGLWFSVKRDHARLIRAAGAERFVLDRLRLGNEVPLLSEVERVRAALERVAVQACL